MVALGLNPPVSELLLINNDLLLFVPRSLLFFFPSSSGRCAFNLGRFHRKSFLNLRGRRCRLAFFFIREEINALIQNGILRSHLAQHRVNCHDLLLVLDQHLIIDSLCVFGKLLHLGEQSFHELFTLRKGEKVLEIFVTTIAHVESERASAVYLEQIRHFFEVFLALKVDDDGLRLGHELEGGRCEDYLGYVPALDKLVNY